MHSCTSYVTSNHKYIRATGTANRTTPWVRAINTRTGEALEADREPRGPSSRPPATRPATRPATSAATGARRPSTGRSALPAQAAHDVQRCRAC